MDYQVAIPSYKRPEQIKIATLATLERYGVDPNRVTIFVANEEEAEAYKASLDPKWRIVTGLIGKVNQQRFYHKYFPAGTPLLNLDDDIYDLVQLTDNDQTEKFTGKLDDLVATGFELCEKTGAKLWGVNPVNNGFFMKNEITVGLRYIGGGLYGNYAGDPAVVGADRPSNISSGDDYETTFRSFLINGSVLRFEYLTWVTKNFARGGIDAELKDRGIQDRQYEHDLELRAIIDRYPDLALLQKKAGGITNIRVRTKTFARIPRRYGN